VTLWHKDHNTCFPHNSITPLPFSFNLGQSERPDFSLICHVRKYTEFLPGESHHIIGCAHNIIKIRSCGQRFSENLGIRNFAQSVHPCPSATYATVCSQTNQHVVVTAHHDVTFLLCTPDTLSHSTTLLAKYVSFAIHPILVSDAFELLLCGLLIMNGFPA
jgi:hypothetical protein